MNNKQILQTSLTAYVNLKRELTDLSATRLGLKMKMLETRVDMMSASPALCEINALVEENNKGIQRLIQKMTRASYFLAAAYGCEYCALGLEENKATVAAADRVRSHLFAILGETSIMDLPALTSELAPEGNNDFFVDLIDLGNIYSRYFENLVVEPKLDF